MVVRRGTNQQRHKLRTDFEVFQGLGVDKEPGRLSGLHATRGLGLRRHGASMPYGRKTAKRHVPRTMPGHTGFHRLPTDYCGTASRLLSTFSASLSWVFKVSKAAEF